MKFCTENVLFGYFLVETLKKLLPFLKSAVSNFSAMQCSKKIQCFLQNKKTSNLGIKKPYLDNWVFLKCNFEKTIVILETRTFKFVKIQNLFILKNFKFWTKNALVGSFWALILKNYCHTWNQHSQDSQDTKFCAKIKIVKFGTKNVLCEYFWAIWKLW